MTGASRPLRLLLLAACVLALAALLWALIGVLHGAIALWRELRDLPVWLQIFIGLCIAIVAVSAAWFGWRLLHPRPRKRAPITPPTRAAIDQRIARLTQQRADTTALQSELEELDRRARSEELYVAVFGEISAGKSSLIRALLPLAIAQVDVLGGTTRAVEHYRGELFEHVTIIFADVPGTHEVSGHVREQMARDEALRAHVVVYLCNGDLNRDQDAELRWLRSFGKPLALVLNKADQFDDADRAMLQRTLRARYRKITDTQFVISAGGSESFERQLADGRHERVQRERIPDVAALRGWLQGIATHAALALEPAREAAILTAMGDRADILETAARERESEAIVAKYTKRAVVGALAAVMPGSDLIIQSVLATALIRELGKLHDVPLRELDIDAFLGQVKLTVRTSTSLVLAIAGNGLKAFPGLGTLSGGVLHAVAYGLIFDSLGHAVSKSMREQHALDAAAANATLAQLLADSSAQRLRRIATLAISAAKDD